MTVFSPHLFPVLMVQTIYKYKVLAWIWRWRSPTKSDTVTSLLHATADWFSCIGSQWACCLTFKYTVWLVQLHCIDQGDHVCCIWGLFHVYLQQQYFLHAHSSMLWMYWQQQRSRSFPARPNTLTLSCNYFANYSESCHERTLVNDWNAKHKFGAWEAILTCPSKLYCFMSYTALTWLVDSMKWLLMWYVSSEKMSGVSIFISLAISRSASKWLSVPIPVIACRRQALVSAHIKTPAWSQGSVFSHQSCDFTLSICSRSQLLQLLCVLEWKAEINARYSVFMGWYSNGSGHT